jgi:hypothetical protein
MSTDVTIFFIFSDLAQIFWIKPVIKRCGKLWFYIDIGGTVILIIMWFIAVLVSGYPVNMLDIAIEIFQIAFIVLCYLIVKEMKKLINKPIN